MHNGEVIRKGDAMKTFHVSFSLGLGVFFSILFLSYFMWSGALDSFELLLSYPVTLLA